MPSSVTSPTHKAGFAGIVGEPNVGKSTLFNALVGSPLSIVTPKPQTTRHRILGIQNGTCYQVIYTDTPGMLTPSYALQAAMKKAVYQTLLDLDVVIWVVDVRRNCFEKAFLDQLRQKGFPLLLLLNKIDLVTPEELAAAKVYWADQVPEAHLIPVAALTNQHLHEVSQCVLTHLPQHPAYYPKDILSDRSLRFFAAEMVRKQLFMHLRKEVPYSTQVVIDSFVEGEDLIRLGAVIYVERASQKHILIGQGGAQLKKVGTAARRALEHFLGKKVFLAQHVKVADHWCKKTNKLASWGFY